MPRGGKDKVQPPANPGQTPGQALSAYFVSDDFKGKVTHFQGLYPELAVPKLREGHAGSLLAAPGHNGDGHAPGHMHFDHPLMNLIKIADLHIEPRRNLLWIDDGTAVKVYRGEQQSLIRIRDRIAAQNETTRDAELLAFLDDTTQRISGFLKSQGEAEGMGKPSSAPRVQRRQRHAGKENGEPSGLPPAPTGRVL